MRCAGNGADKSKDTFYEGMTRQTCGLYARPSAVEQNILRKIRKGAADMTKLSGSQEDYLKEIYLMHMRGQEIRVTDIAATLGISKPSVNKAINSLKEQGYITHEHYGAIALTDAGMEAGEDIAENFRISNKFLVEVLGVESGVAELEAHGMEHIISRGTRKKMKKFMKKLKKQDK